MGNIKVGIVGKIIKGDEEGSFIKVVDDKINTGGYLILTSSNTSFNNSFDGWVENELELKNYFIESGWKVEWIYYSRGC